MLSYQIKQQIDATLDIIEEVGPLLNLLSSLANHYDECLSHLKGIALGGDKHTSSAATIHSLLAQTPGSLNGSSSRKVFSALELLTGALRTLSQIGDEEVNYATQTVVHLDEFSDALDTFLVSPTPVNAVSLLANAQLSHQALLGVLGTIRLISSTLEKCPPDSEHTNAFSMLLPMEDNLSVLISRLAAIQSLYSELCRLLSVSEIDYPLLVGKIETGSLWVRLFGETRVIGLIVDFLRASAGFFYRNFTSEGKISSLPRKVDSLDRILQLREKLSEQGIASSELDDELSKSSVLIARALTTILERESSVAINGQTISVGDSADQARLSAEQWPMLDAPHNGGADTLSGGNENEDTGAW